MKDSADNAYARREFLRRRAKEFVMEGLLSGPEPLEFAGLTRGRRETAAILDRARRAVYAHGKSIWSRSLLTHEAPYLFVDSDSEAEEQAMKVFGTTVHFKCEPTKIRIFPRGILTIEQEWTLTKNEAPITVVQFIAACKEARLQASDEAWSRIRSLLTGLSGQRAFAALPTHWLDTSETAEAFVRQHVIKHAILFLQSPPGIQPGSPHNGRLDKLSTDERKPIVGLLNLTEWYSIYADHYIETVFKNVVQNRRDEIYLTDNDASVVICAKYWDDGDPLRYYLHDIVLASQFELSRLSHLRYLAYYMRVAPEAQGALALDQSDGRSALSFALEVQQVVQRSSYDHPAEVLIQHGFTRRFLAQIGSQRFTKASSDELDSYIVRIARAVELKSGLDLSEKNFGVARSTLVVTWIAVAVAVAGVMIALMAGG